MAYDKATRNKVRQKYVQGVPLKTAAEAAGVAYQTARTWKSTAADSGDDWDVARRAKHLTSGSIRQLTHEVLEELVEQFGATLQVMREEKDLKPAARADMLLRLSDAYVKAMAAAARGNPQLDKLAVAMEVLKAFGEFIAERFPTLRTKFVEVIEEFGPEVVKRFGAGA